ncbi:MAG: ATP-binding protein [Desulfuromonadales bacterium]
MRLSLKHQIILAPAAVLLLMSLLLGFLQYNYWDLSLKRQQARKMTTVFIALAEADLAAQRMHHLAVHFSVERQIEVSRVEEMGQLFVHLEGAIGRILELLTLPDSTRALLLQAESDLNPEHGFSSERFLAAISLLRPQLASLSDMIQQQQRDRLRDVHRDDIDELVARTTFVSILVLGAAILVGVALSLTFATRIQRRLQLLSDSAGRIVRGELTPPPAPQQVRDELDDLAVSINLMTDRLIRVVSTEKLLEGAEEERRRIAMDIHDQTLSDLSSVLRGIQDLQRSDSCRIMAADLEQELQRALANLREVMDNLHPQTLEILGLGAALQSHLERHMASGDLPRYHFSCAPEVETMPLSRIARLSLYRIAIEAVHNVIKHAGANRYEVMLDRRNGTLVLSVEDNGRGFNPAAASDGRGLNNIRERARVIGATVSWKSSRFSTGTRFELSLPVQAATE